MIRRAERKTNYTIMGNAGINDERLSFKATGLLAYLLSKPDNWNINELQLADVKQDKRDGVRAALKELEDAGYILRTKRRSEDGKFLYASTVYDEPIKPRPVLDLAVLDLPTLEKPTLEKPTLENPTVISTVITSTVETSTVVKEQLKAKPSTSHPNTKPILEAYMQELGYSPNSFGEAGKAAKNLAEAGFSPEDVVAMYTALKAQAFWSSKYLSLSEVWKQSRELANYAKNGGDINRPSTQRKSKAELGREAGDRVAQKLIDMGMESLLH